MPNSTILEMTGVQKSFGAVVALNNANFQLNSKEIHGLLGGNGAGKTTLMNILFGLYRPDAGQILLHDQPVDIHVPRDAIRLGIGMVHQHFLQIESFTVTQNIVLGSSLKHKHRLNLTSEEKQIRELAERFGLEVDPGALIEELPLGIRQRVEILKALYRGVEILILDEPTTNLTPHEVESLFLSLRKMVDQGMSVIFITHKIREVMGLCDRITVMKDGQHVATLEQEESSEERLVATMIGEDLDFKTSLLFSDESTEEAVIKTVVGEGLEPDEDISLITGRTAALRAESPVLQIKDLNVMSEDSIHLIKDCSFQIHTGEILGIAGVAGNGQRELVETILGLRAAVKGQIKLNDMELAGIETAEVLAKGVTYIPEDRLQDGFLPTANVAQNLVLGFHRGASYSKNGFLDWGAIFDSARRMIAEYNIRTPGPDEPAANLSGGNIQRVMLARAFSHSAVLLVAHNPTRGLDIPSMEFVYAKLLELKQQGMATLLLSEDLDELLLLSDRIAVIYKGQILDILERSEFDRYKIGRLMGGVSD